MNDLVSVIIPVFNGAQHLPETLACVLAQSHPRVEIIVVDDGSTDASFQIASSHGPAVRVLQQPNRGPGSARNRGLAAARGDYLALLDHDDLWHPDILASQLDVARRHPQSGMVICDGVHFQGDAYLKDHLLSQSVVERMEQSPGGELSGDFRDEIICHNPIACPAQTLIPRHVVDAIGPLSNVEAECTDWEYYLRLAWRFPLTFHNRKLVRKRYLDSNRSGPLEMRRIRYALQELPALTRLLRTLPADERAVLRRLVRGKLQLWAWCAYDGKLPGDSADARAFLAELARLGPLNTTVLAVLASLSLPRAWLRGLAFGTRQLRAALGLLRP